jgi:hypothetical protein
MFLLGFSEILLGDFFYPTGVYTSKYYSGIGGSSVKGR